MINVSPEVERFLRYIETGQVEDEYTRQLQGSVALARKNREWRADYMKTFCHDVDVRREGIEIGKEIGRSQGQEEKLVSQVCAKLRKGKAKETIAEELEEDICKVSDICEVAKLFAPDYNEKEVCELYMERHIF